MRKIYNRIDNLVLFKGVHHACRVINVKIVKVNVMDRVIEVDEAAVRRIKYIRREFSVDPGAVIATKDNKILSLSQVKQGNRVIIDFIKSDRGRQLVKGLTILK